MSRPFSNFQISNYYYKRRIVVVKVCFTFSYLRSSVSDLIPEKESIEECYLHSINKSINKEADNREREKVNQQIGSGWFQFKFGNTWMFNKNLNEFVINFDEWPML